MSAILKRITRRAKEIYKKHPSMKWTSAIKQASKDIKHKRISGTVQTGVIAGVKRRRKRIAGAVKKRRRAIGSKSMVSGVGMSERAKLIERLGKLLARRDINTKRNVHFKLTREISNVRSRLKKLS